MEYLPLTARLKHPTFTVLAHNMRSHDLRLCTAVILQTVFNFTKRSMFEVVRCSDGRLYLHTITLYSTIDVCPPRTTLYLQFTAINFSLLSYNGTRQFTCAEQCYLNFAHPSLGTVEHISFQKSSHSLSFSLFLFRSFIRMYTVF